MTQCLTPCPRCKEKVNRSELDDHFAAKEETTAAVTKVVNNIKATTNCIINYKITDSKYNQCINNIQPVVTI